MALEQFAYLAQVVGVVLVIASLVYVARQLHLNTEAIRFGVANTLVQMTVQAGTEIVTNREVADYWVKAGRRFDELDDVDKQRAIIFEYRAIQAWSHWFHLHKKGLMPDEQWQEIVWFIQEYGGIRQDVREAWKIFKNGYSTDFRAFVTPYLE